MPCDRTGTESPLCARHVSCDMCSTRYPMAHGIGAAREVWRERHLLGRCCAFRHACADLSRKCTFYRGTAALRRRMLLCSTSNVALASDHRFCASDSARAGPSNNVGSMAESRAARAAASEILDSGREIGCCPASAAVVPSFASNYYELFTTCYGSRWRLTSIGRVERRRPGVGLLGRKGRNWCALAAREGPSSSTPSTPSRNSESPRKHKLTRPTSASSARDAPRTSLGTDDAPRHARRATRRRHRIAARQTGHRAVLLLVSLTLCMTGPSRR